MDNCIVRGGGRIFPGCVGVLIGQSSENQVTHNDIADLFYTSISVGWTWGYGESRCRKNIIEYNHLHHIGRGVLSDMGGRVHPGHLSRHERQPQRDPRRRLVQPPGAGGWGLYNDEGSTGIRLENNLVYNTTTGSYHQHYGKDNVVRNNILAFSRYGQVMRTRAEPHLSFTLDRNIVIWKGGPLLTGDWSGRNFRLDNNLYFETAGQTVAFAGADPRRVAEADRAGPALAGGRPRFRRRRGPRLPPEARRPLGPDRLPAVRLHQGRCVRRSGVDQGGERPPAPDRLRPRAPAGGDQRGLRVARAGRRRIRARGGLALARGPARDDRIIDEAAAGGRQSLRFTDAAGLKFDYDPHLDAKLGKDADGCWSLAVTLPGKDTVRTAGLPCGEGWTTLAGSVSSAMRIIRRPSTSTTSR